jgi:hypothetical protein
VSGTRTSRYAASLGADRLTSSCLSSEPRVRSSRWYPADKDPMTRQSKICRSPFRALDVLRRVVQQRGGTMEAPPLSSVRQHVSRFHMLRFPFRHAVRQAPSNVPEGLAIRSHSLLPCAWLLPFRQSIRTHDKPWQSIREIRLNIKLKGMDTLSFNALSLHRTRTLRIDLRIVLRRASRGPLILHISKSQGFYVDNFCRCMNHNQ